MADYQWTEMKSRLLVMKKEIIAMEKIGEDAAKPVELDQCGMGRLSRMDAMQTQAMALEAQSRRKLNLQRIDSALVRIEKGNYGLCVRCKQEISAARLDFDPAVLICIKCAK
ncbi:TraR/DksA family transcriptional regulator [bacterium]|nr:TraR/DksA family transcriptional regulator [bacterium]